MRSLALLLLVSVPLFAADWPQWMGPTRDDVWTEPGIITKFPAGGPKKLWSEKIHGGYSGPSVADGRVYVMDYVKTAGNSAPDPAKQNKLQGDERVLCFDAVTGKPLWEHKYDCPYQVSYPAGPRCTPTVHDGKVYALGTMGNLTCLDAVKGTLIWKKDFELDFNSKTPNWGFAGHPLVYKNLLICNVGGPTALLAAFDKNTGKVKWQSMATPTAEGPGYCPPSLVEAGGVTQLILWHPNAIVAVNPEDGTEYWHSALKPNYGMSIMMPRLEKDLLYAGGIGNVAVMLRLGKTADDKPVPTAAVVWQGAKNTALYPANSTPIIEDGTIYGVDVSGHLRAVKLSTGERYWETTDATVEVPNNPLPHGTAFLVRNSENKHYYLFNEKGSLIIANLTPAKYTEIDRAHLLKPTTPAFNRTVLWSHPAFANKCIFVRNDEEIACYDLR
ncbi:PQQ-like beta-propeller repeat protein [soil metagenome]